MRRAPRRPAPDGAGGLTGGPLLVTGASGFLGRHVLHTLQSGPEAPRRLALVRDAERWRGMDWTGALGAVETLVGSVTEPDAWTASPALRGLGGILHLAAVVRHTRREADEIYRTNVHGTENMVRLAAAHGCRLVFVSTSGTVGCFRRPAAAAHEGAPYCDTEVARWPYYASKIEAEKRARRLATELGVPLVIVRPPILFGPGDHPFRTTAPLVRYLRGKLPFLIRGGMHFADVRDAARAIVRALELPEPRPVYHLPGTVMSIEDFFALAERVSGVAAPRVILPYPIAWGLAKAFERFGVLPDPVMIEMASRYWGVTSLYAMEELGYHVRDGAETLADTIDWLRAHHPALAKGGGPA